MIIPRYTLAGKMTGFHIESAWTRIDRPPNASGARYTEFRDKTGAVKAVYLTDILA